MEYLSNPTTTKPGALRRARLCVQQRVARLPSWLVLTQLFIGFGWFRAVAEKVTDPQWWAGATIDHFLGAHDGATLGWYQPFVQAVVVPAAPIVALVVVAAQLGAGLSLVTGRRLGLGLTVGMFLNLNFLAAGAVAPSAFYLLAQGSIALWLAERHPSAGTINRLKIAAATCAVLVTVSLPFISTLDPHRVIDDPAMMFAFGGVLGAFGCVLAINTITRTRSGLRKPAPAVLAPQTNHEMGVFSASVGPR